MIKNNTFVENMYILIDSTMYRCYNQQSNNTVIRYAKDKIGQ